MDALDTQRRRALERANEVRSARAELKRRIRAGDVDLVALFRDGETGDTGLDAHLDGMAVADLLYAIPGFGPLTVRAVAREAGGLGNRLVGVLSTTERDQLAREVMRRVDP